jgi:hypothetical protein
MRRLLLANVMLLSLMACGVFPFGRARKSSETTKPRCENDGGAVGRGHADLELREAHYNGEFLAGTLLIGAIGGNICIDKRLVPGWDVTLDSVSDCSKESMDPVPFMVIHSFSRPPSDGHVLILEPGYWYGGPINMPLFMSEQPTGKRNPDCVDVSLTLHPLEGPPVDSVRVRAWRDSRLPPDGGVSPDGGLSLEAEPSPDDVNPGRVWVPFRDGQ